ncbi:hypothetical protein OG196_01280 [Kitasatospora purpeofusca]|uniref:hypothetical protein n=1 Tax=Kitasatospora purpeofusca TaxID=67352 RepID=UPI002E0D2AAE|nr:hypothetical protein OG715_00745 [Kitasatospora purpeofusca]WSR37828.1 hypothetical protein OG196_01280 [Kitasatospora purpeofusca]
MKRNPVIGLLGALTLATAAVTTGSAAQAAAGDVLCTAPSSDSSTYSPPLSLTPASTTVTITRDLNTCTSLSVPAINSAPVTVHQVTISSYSCPTLLNSAPTVITFTWNNGATTVVTGTRTVNLAGAALTTTVTGTVTSGLFTGDTAVYQLVAPSAAVLACTLGLGTVSRIDSIATLTID